MLNSFCSCMIYLTESYSRCKSCLVSLFPDSIVQSVCVCTGRLQKLAMYGGSESGKQEWLEKDFLHCTRVISPGLYHCFHRIIDAIHFKHETKTHLQTNQHRALKKNENPQCIIRCIKRLKCSRTLKRNLI